MVVIKTRKQKAKQYEQEYGDIPKDYLERLDWMYNKYHMNINKAAQILKIRDHMLQTIHFEKEFFIVLYEEPEGTPRPRARLVDLVSTVKSNPRIQIYSLTGKVDNMFMKKLLEDEEIYDLQQNLIYTPCFVEYTTYHKTPSSYSIEDKYLAEIGMYRPIGKPDFDNIEKKYADMYNGNIWLDDMLVVSAKIEKYYSILPRIEISLHYLNMLYNKHQYKQIQSRIEQEAQYYKKEDFQ